MLYRHCRQYFTIYLFSAENTHRRRIIPGVIPVTVSAGPERQLDRHEFARKVITLKEY